MEAIKPKFELRIEGKNVTDDVSPFVSQILYMDKLEGESDEVSIVLDDIAALWQTDWYPQQGDTLAVKMGYEGSELLDCGLFEIDEIELTGQPDIMTVKGIAAAINKDLRTRNSRAYENQTLKKIAQFIADKHGLNLIDNTSQLANIEVGRKTQDNENDLAFLAGLCKRFGIIFSVRGKDLIFLDPADLEAKDAINKDTPFKRSDLSKYSFKDKTAETYDSASVSKRDIKTNKVQKWKVVNDADPTKKDDLVVGGRVENEGQAEALAAGGLREKNKDKLTGSFQTDGNPLLVAGVNVEMSEFGGFSGKWMIYESRHIISIDNGYKTDVSIRKGVFRRTFQKVGGNGSGGGNKNWRNIIGLT